MKHFIINVWRGKSLIKQDRIWATFEQEAVDLYLQLNPAYHNPSHTVGAALPDPSFLEYKA